jgi:hypothetical protein
LRVASPEGHRERVSINPPDSLDDMMA